MNKLEKDIVEILETYEKEKNKYGHVISTYIGYYIPDKKRIAKAIVKRIEEEKKIPLNKKQHLLSARIDL